MSEYKPTKLTQIQRDALVQRLNGVIASANSRRRDGWDESYYVFSYKDLDSLVAMAARTTADFLLEVRKEQHG